jgi:hypothetical protein
MAVLAALVLTTLACGLFSGGSEDAPEMSEPIPATEAVDVESPVGEVDTDETDSAPEAPDPTATTAPVESGSNGAENSGEGPQSLNLEDGLLFTPPNVNSYRLSMDYSFSGVDANGNPLEGDMEIKADFIKEPSASRMFMEGAGAFAEGMSGPMEMVETGGSFYLYSDEFGCMSARSGESFNPMDDLLNDVDDLLGEAQRVYPDEVINGMDTYVYEITEENIVPDTTTDLQIEELTTAKVYVSKEYDTVVRVYMEGYGRSDVLTEDETAEGTVIYDVNFYDLDAAFTIEAPEGCGGAAGGETPYPVPEDSDVSIVMQVEGIFAYETSMSPADVLAFYEEELPALGYTINASSAFGDAATMELTGPDGESIIAFFATAEGQPTTVTFANE